MDHSEDSQPQEQPTQQPKSSSQSNHIRSRITVVCAECKRLKLRCDRRSPCGSCVKRDTVERCKYSQAATEKVDLQSVNNRVLVLEAQVASLNSVNNIPRSIPQPDRTFAIGNSGSSLAVSLDDVTSIWLSHLSPSIKLKLETAPVELPTDDLLPAALFPPISTFRASSSPLEPPSVTKQLMALLPTSVETRHRLLLAVEDILALHPCFNFPHFQTRIHSMFSWVKDFESTSLQDQFSDSTTRASKPTLSFFGAASAAFALGSLVTKVDDTSSAMMICDDSSFVSGTANGSAPTDDPSCSSAALFALSEQSLSVFEKSYSYDLDYLVAMVLQIIFLLHHGKPRLAHTLFPLVGKMVNVARMMGLGIDPDDFPGTYPLFEAETRRRMWWDIFYYDLFVSDFMGHPPLIADNSFTTKLPADVDEQQFNPFSTSLPIAQDWCKTSNAYFGMKCRLAQLVKDLKKRMFMDPMSHSESELTIEKAAEFESRITEFTASLPSDYQINLNTSNLPPPNDPHGTLILARACELHTIANRLVVSLYLPFLKTSRSNPPHQASLAIVNSAHKIIQAMKMWKIGMTSGSHRDKGRWGSFGVYYEYGRILFDAAVVCASMSIDCYDSAFAQCVREDVDVALEIMRDMEDTKMSGRRPLIAGVASGLEGNVSEGVKIVEMLGKKADALRSGMKRKRQDTDRDVLMPGFILPFVGAGVSSAGAINDSQDAASSHVPVTSPKISRQSLDPGTVKVKVEALKSESLLDSRKRFMERSESMEPEKKKSGKGKEKDKTQKYPTYGIRIRPGFAPPYARNRTSSSPSNNGSGLSPDPMLTSNSDGIMLHPRPTSSGMMLPPVPAATPSSLGSSTPQQVEDQPGGYFSNPVFPQTGSVARHDDSSLSLQGSFLGSYEPSADLQGGPVDKRYSTPTFPERTSFYNHGYQPASETTSPSSAQPTPQFPPTPLSAGHYGSSSQHQSDYYIGNYGGAHSFNNDHLRSSTGRDDSVVFPMNTSDRSDSNSSFISSQDKMPINGFAMPSDDIHQGQGQFKGRPLQISRGQDWMSPASGPDGGDPYWYKIYSE